MQVPGTVELTDTGVRLRCKVIPKSSHTGWGGIRDGRILVRVAAAPSDGKANEAMLRFIGKAFDTPMSRIRIERGASIRLKTIFITNPGRIPRCLNPAP